jgi:hypothetical protein
MVEPVLNVAAAAFQCAGRIIRWRFRPLEGRSCAQALRRGQDPCLRGPKRFPERLSAAHLAAIAFPEPLRRLYVACDDDRAGSGALKTLGERATPLGIEIVPLRPERDDFNSDLCVMGQRRLAALLRPQLMANGVMRILVWGAEPGGKGGLGDDRGASAMLHSQRLRLRPSLEARAGCACRKVEHLNVDHIDGIGRLMRVQTGHSDGGLSCVPPYQKDG